MAKRLSHKGMMHGIDWPAGENPAGFLMQEKFNGCRVLWDGAELVSRHGRRITLPISWRMPVMPLDCELYAGPAGVYRCADALKHDRVDSRSMFLIAFDAPAAPGGYFHRYSQMRAMVSAANCPHIIVPPLTVCDDTNHAAAMLESTLHLGGEGLMLRSPHLPYTAGRVAGLCKLKRPDQLRPDPDA